jgi:GT2 family glycosyltransferase
MLVRAECWRDVGKLDESFFFYGEEVDLQLRARLRGWRVVYEPLAKVYHREGGTGGAKSKEWRELHATMSGLEICQRYAPHAYAVACAFAGARSLRWLALGDVARAKAIFRGVLMQLQRTGS